VREREREKERERERERETKTMFHIHAHIYNLSNAGSSSVNSPRIRGGRHIRAFQRISTNLLGGL
jgi:hypothetical protein